MIGGLGGVVKGKNLGERFAARREIAFVKTQVALSPPAERAMTPPFPLIFLLPSAALIVKPRVMKRPSN
jgi:hypothetical protein